MAHITFKENTLQQKPEDIIFRFNSATDWLGQSNAWEMFHTLKIRVQWETIPIYIGVKRVAHHGTQKIILGLNDQESLQTFFDTNSKLGLYIDFLKKHLQWLLKNSKNDLVFMRRSHWEVMTAGLGVGGRQPRLGHEL